MRGPLNQFRRAADSRTVINARFRPYRPPKITSIDPPHNPPPQGVPTKNHRVQKELERVKGYMTRLQVIKAPAPAAAPKPALKVDAAASQRMVVGFRARAGWTFLPHCWEASGLDFPETSRD